MSNLNLTEGTSTFRINLYKILRKNEEQTGEDGDI